MTHVTLIGIGMGNPDTLTLGAVKALKGCDCLIGAPRLLESLEGYTDAPRVPLILAGEIAAYLGDHPQYEEAAVVLSGDVGFYSGAKKLWELLKDYPVTTISGVSSLQYFCARIQTPWEDVHPVSAHGRSCDFAAQVYAHPKVFFLLDNAHTPAFLCGELCRRGLEDARVWVGERLSYPDETITHGTARELAQRDFGSLAVALVENHRLLGQDRRVHGLPDDCFRRGEVPMTKEEVRSVSLSRLAIREKDVIWDVGAGTGSVSVEAALQAPLGRVFGVEHNPDACRLIRENRQALGAWNLEVVEGEAPQALEPLPPPDCVFVGGSGGNLGGILRIALEKNPRARVVITAITLETVAEGMSRMKELAMEDIHVIQLSAARSRKAGPYHLMMGQNPVTILSGRGGGR